MVFSGARGFRLALTVGVLGALAAISPEGATASMAVPCLAPSVRLTPRTNGLWRAPAGLRAAVRRTLGTPRAFHGRAVR
jgi:hypothetical protein